MRHTIPLAAPLGVLAVLLGACGGSHPAAPTDSSPAFVDRDSGPGEGREGDRQDDRRPREGRAGRR